MNQELPFKTWEYEDQTKMKHLIFADYFDAWVKILGKHHNLNYIDCFGGPGAYDDDGGKPIYGSPLLAAQIAKTNNKKVCLVIIDKDKKNIENLKKIFEYLKLDVNVEFVNTDFDIAINNILDSAKDRLAPTFFFIDPFGYKIKMSTLERIIKIPKSEILLNFMYNAVTRWFGYPQVEKTYTELFGCEDWRGLRKLKGREREAKIIEFFRLKLKVFCKLVCPYKMMFPDKARTYYYLFHLTNHYKGCEIMKSSFAKHNLGKLEYQGKFSNQMSLNDLPEVKIQKIKKIVLDFFKGRQKYLDILEAIIDEPAYLMSDIRKAVTGLEEEKKITIERNPPTTPRTGKLRKSLIPETDYIIFH